jgi:hypothetical protein
MINMATKKKVIVQRAGGGVRRIGRGDAPDFGNMLAGVLGGGIGALAGGLLVRWDVNPTLAAVVMTVGGGVAAYTMDGKARAAAAGLAAAGAGQLALAMLAKSSEKKPDQLAEGEKKPANLALPPGALESAFERAQDSLARLEDDEARYRDVIDVDDYEVRAAA